MQPRSASILAALAAVSFACAAAGQAPSGRIPNEIQTAAQALDPAQKEVVAAYVASQATAFAAGDPDRVAEIRDANCKLLRGPVMRDPCRREFGSEFVESFRQFVKPGDPLRTTNAFIIARHAPCAETMSFLIENSDIAVQQDPVIRVAASSQLPITVRDGQFAGPQAESNARRIASALKAETDWVVAGHQSDALVETLRTKGLSAETAGTVAGLVADSINDLAARSLGGSSPSLMNPLQRSLLAVRNRTSEVAPAARAKLFSGISATLTKLVGMKGKPPQGVSSEEEKKLFDSTTNTAEVLLQIQRSVAK